MRGNAGLRKVLIDSGGNQHNMAHRGISTRISHGEEVAERYVSQKLVTRAGAGSSYPGPVGNLHWLHYEYHMNDSCSAGSTCHLLLSSKGVNFKGRF